MIVITGAAGFIGSALLGFFNRHFPDVDIILVDNFSRRDKDRNYRSKKWITSIERDAFFGHFDEHKDQIHFVFHLGARTDTTEKDVHLLNRLNLDYSKKMWEFCSKYAIPLVYASSAATYGDGSLGFADNHEIIEELQPLNPYGVSKNEFDKWVLKQEEAPPFWTGLKFFNVYGPNEYHKGRMASVVYHAFHQIRVTKHMQLFRSHRSDIGDGQQLRDFIYVEDVLKICSWLYEHHTTVESGIYNVGSGMPNSFEALTQSVFKSMGLKPSIEYIDIPEDIRANYQYYTCADMSKLAAQGYVHMPVSLEGGVQEYVRNFLMARKYL